MRLTRRYTREDRAEAIYQYIVVDVPSRAQALEVTLEYDRSETVLDLGLIGPDRFRGWSGSERSTVVVTEEWATPGYQPGVVSGPWQIVLGLYRVAPSGVDVAVDLSTPEHRPERPASPPLPPRPARPPARRLPAAPGHEWLAADFHSHTVHSDGALEVVELAALAAGQGLDVLAVTDHNTVSHHPHLAAAGDHAGILLVAGQEVTTDHGHANCFGEIGWIDFRDPPDTWQATATERGGVMSVNHPWAWDCAWRMPIAGPADLVEAWHWTWDRQDPAGVADWPAFGRRAIGGSDFHRPADGILPGSPTTWLECADRSVAAVLDALRHGRIAISADPAGPVLLRDGDELVTVDADGCELVERDGAGWLVADGRVVAVAP
jgi:PHP domain-containing protein